MGAESHRGPVPARIWVMFIAALVVASAVGIVLGLAINWFPAQGSSIAHRIDTFWDVLLIISVPIAVIVLGTVIFAIARWRVRPGEENLDGPPTHGSTRLEIIWTAIPTLIIAGLCAYATILLLDIQEAPAKNARVVKVTGQQFAWSFEMNEGGKKIASNVLYVPVGEQVTFKVRSKDVIHDFWVPEWRLKIDAVPGITTSYSITPIKTGSFQIVCAELCGLGHAYMRQRVIVVSPAQYEAWVRRVSQAAAPAAPAGSGGTQTASVDPKQLFVAGKPDTGALACGSCHVLKAAGTSGAVGPNLDTSLASDDRAAQIKEMIVAPNKEIVKGYGPNIMPANYGQTLTAQEIDALSAYIDQSVHGGK
ncbi:MAG: cytochrome c oxidase subunit II [Actinobacteria bacterium]|nr:cytochrome c oxidase subunit II [Actinomycetota bacterium]